MSTELAAWRAVPIAPELVGPLRRRALWTLFAGVALTSTGYIAAGTAGTLVAQQLGGSAAFGGLPTTAAVLGTAAGTVSLSAVMLRRGRRPGMVVGLGIAAFGAVMAFTSVIAGSLPVLLLGTFLAGWGNAAGQLARYVAGDMFSAERRASALGTVVWGATLGAVIGPNLMAPAGVMANGLGLPDLAGAYGVTLAFSVLALALAYLLLRPDPYALADESALHATDAASSGAPMGVLLRRTPVLVALITLLAGQVVMVLIMTMTPLHIQAHGHGLETVGLVLSAHTFGMFALSPVSGRLTDRFGSPAVIGAGLGTLALASLLAAVAPADGGPLLTLALFLLGYGWNLGYVAGSTMLSRGLGLADRTRLQGITDGLIWSSAALASLASGLVVAGASYTLLGLLGVVLLVGPALVLTLRAPRLRRLEV